MVWRSSRIDPQWSPTLFYVSQNLTRFKKHFAAYTLFCDKKRNRKKVSVLRGTTSEIFFSFSIVDIFEGHVITRGGPHFQATCANMRTLASDHVTKNSQFVENLTENCFQTRSLSCLVEILWSRDHLRGSAISSYVPKCADPREWSCDQKFSVWWDSTLDKPLSFLDFVFFPGPFLNFLFILS